MRDASGSALFPFRRLRLSLCLIAAAGLLLAAPRGRGSSPAAARVTRARYLMGTVLEIDAVGPGRDRLEAAIGEAFEEVARTEARLSNWRPGSELSRANRAASSEPLRLTPETFFSLERAIALSRETGGAFDPTVGGLTEALGLTGRAPDPAGAELARHSVHPIDSDRVVYGVGDIDELEEQALTSTAAAPAAAGRNDQDRGQERHP